MINQNKIKAKIRNNQLCPCGSGMEYQYCHLSKSMDWELIGETYDNKNIYNNMQLA